MPKGELLHNDPYTLLVAVVLSAQATDAGVNKATPALFAAGPNAGEDGGARRGQGARSDQDHRPVSHQGEERRRALADSWSPSTAVRCRVRAKRSKRCPASDARPPMSCSTWRSASRPSRSIPTFSAIGNRTGLAPGKTPLEVELKLLEVVPDKYMLHAHHWLILHGRYICLARRPLCEKCLIADLCKWPGKTVAA